MSDAPPAGSAVRRLRVAAVQMPSILGAIGENLAVASSLAERAAGQQAELILFHELMPGGYAWDARAWTGAEPSDGPTARWLRANATRTGTWIGTSFLEAAAGDFWNTFVLVGPDGHEVGRVRKQYPALYEARTFRGEAGSHVIETAIGRIGVGICFDSHTADVAQKFASAGVDLVLAPHCYCVPVRPSRGVSARDIERLRSNVTGLAPLLATSLGVPVVVTNRIGAWDADRGTPYTFVGQATIADADGSVVGRFDDDPGCIVADVTLDPARKTGTAPRAYSRWIYPGPPGRELLRALEWWAARGYRGDRERLRLATEIGRGGDDASPV